MIDRSKRVKLIIGVLCRREFKEEVLKHIESFFGPVELDSAEIPFTFTDYYQEELGEDLIRFWVTPFGKWSPDCLIWLKRQAMEIETILKNGDKRRANIDPGILTPAKVILTSTKDYAHRIYLGRGVYAEVTLIYHKDKGYEPLPWTYPDYRTEEAREFFEEVRRSLVG